MGISLNVRSGRIYRIVDCPPGWAVHIQNDPAWSATLEGHAIVGAAAITPQEASGLIVVAPVPRVDALPDDGPVSVTGRLTVMRSGYLSTMKAFRFKLLPYSETH